MTRPLRHALAALLLALLVTPVARAQSPGSWASQLDELTRWVETHRGPAPCTENCFALTRLRITGAIEPGPLRFELEGAVLAAGAVDVPLFGPPDHVRLDDVTQDGAPAAVSFSGNRYFVRTNARRFVIRGSLALLNELALTIPGPVNALDVEVTGARVVEGAHLAGVADVTLHLDRGTPAVAAAGPTVYQRSHAIRVGRELGFTDRLVLQSGTDLGVVRVALRAGQRVLDVTGATGWRVEGAELVLPTAGRSADVTVTGTLAAVGSFEPDPRSEYEWWLLESDAEHRLTVTGDARQIDAAESPIPRTQQGSRLYLVERGHHLAVAVQALHSVDALAAVVHAHRRMTVLTRRGDLVSDDAITYENNGIDYLTLDPQGHPIFLATDGAAERIMHADQGAREVLVSLRNGRHEVRAQTLGHASLGLFGGSIEVPTPTYRLTASRVTADVGFPSFVTPLAVLGGDRPWFAFALDDLLAVLFALGLGALLERENGRRALLGGAIAGAWFVSGALYAAAIIAAGVWVLRGLLFRRGRSLASTVALGALALVVGVVVAGTVGLSRSARGPMHTVEDGRYRQVAVAPRPPSAQPATETCNGIDDNCNGLVESSDQAQTRGGLANARRSDNNALQQVTRGLTNGYWAVTDSAAMVQGVTPVAITLPAYERVISVSRELVTRERPFAPRVYYVTTWTTGLLALAWAAVLLLLARAHRETLARWAAALRERLRVEAPETTTAETTTTGGEP
ncbi:MAG: hypothetical protein JWM10_2920 [Myxococcaceae bacterium]|nr:hypothetical protein [Myxococcaceae bacterium]